MTERLTDSDLRWYLRMKKQIEQTELSAAALRQSLTAMLVEFYELKDGEHVTDDGEIIRNKPKQAS